MLRTARRHRRYLAAGPVAGAFLPIRGAVLRAGDRLHHGGSLGMGPAGRLWRRRRIGLVGGLCARLFAGLVRGVARAAVGMVVGWRGLDLGRGWRVPVAWRRAGMGRPAQVAAHGVRVCAVDCRLAGGGPGPRGRRQLPAVDPDAGVGCRHLCVLCRQDLGRTGACAQTGARHQPWQELGGCVGWHGRRAGAGAGLAMGRQRDPSRACPACTAACSMRTDGSCCCRCCGWPA